MLGASDTDIWWFMEKGWYDMTQIKEKAIKMIQRMPEDNMLYVINILENMEAMYADKV